MIKTPCIKKSFSKLGNSCASPWWHSRRSCQWVRDWQFIRERHLMRIYVLALMAQWFRMGVQLHFYHCASSKVCVSDMQATQSRSNERGVFSYCKSEWMGNYEVSKACISLLHFELYVYYKYLGYNVCAPLVGYRTERNGMWGTFN